MGSSEELKPSKPEKPSSPAKDQSTLHAYPDWAMVHAYYGPQFAVPPYLNSAVASPHIPPPYMWVPPQYMIPHQHGTSYPVFYAQEGVYGHPGVFMAGTSFNTDAPAESSGNTDESSMKKKWKDFQGLAVSVGNGNAGSGDHGTDHRLSESEETGDSSDGSNGVMAEAGQSGLKRSRAGSPKSTKGDKDLKKYESTFETSCPANSSAKTMEDTGSVPELKDSSVLIVKPISTYDPESPTATEALLQNERDLKQEKRKLSNRESAKRSRLRKQAEAGELATKVQKLTIENITLKSEMDKFVEVYKKLELENATLMEKLEDARPGQVNGDKIDGVRPKPVDTVNLLARVNSSGSTDRTNEDDGDSHENRSRTARLHLLLDAIASSPGADAIAAG